MYFVGTCCPASLQLDRHRAFPDPGAPSRYRCWRTATGRDRPHGRSAAVVRDHPHALPRLSYAGGDLPGDTAAAVGKPSPLRRMASPFGEAVRPSREPHPRRHAATRRGSHLCRASPAWITRTSDGREEALRARAHAEDAAVGDGVQRRGAGGAPCRRTCPRGSGKLPPPESSAATDGGGGGRSGGDGLGGGWHGAPGEGPPPSMPARQGQSRAKRKGTARYSTRQRLAGGHLLARFSDTEVRPVRTSGIARSLSR